MPINGISPRLVRLWHVNRFLLLTEFNKTQVRRSERTDRINVLINRYDVILNRIQAKMPKGKKKAEDKFVWKGYINVNIPSDAIPDAENYLEASEQVFQHLTTAIASGLSVKVYHSDKNDSVQCTIQDYNPESPNFGHAMSGFGHDWYTAIGITMFKHFVYCEADWNIRAVTTKRKFG